MTEQRTTYRTGTPWVPPPCGVNEKGELRHDAAYLAQVEEHDRAVRDKWEAQERALEQRMHGWIAQRSLAEDLLLAERVNKLSHVELDLVWQSLDLIEKRKHVCAVLLALDERAKKGHADGD